VEVVFVTGWGWAVFYSQDPTLTQGPGGYFSGNSHPAPFPRQSRTCYNLFLTGAHLGYGCGGGLSADSCRECQKDTPSQAVEWGRAGKRARGQHFMGTCPPCNELYVEDLAYCNRK